MGSLERSDDQGPLHEIGRFPTENARRREIVNDTPHDASQDVLHRDVPGSLEWSKEKLHAGEPEALIAHLDAACMWLRPSKEKRRSQITSIHHFLAATPKH